MEKQQSYAEQIITRFFDPLWSIAFDAIHKKIEDYLLPVDYTLLDLLLALEKPHRAKGGMGYPAHLLYDNCSIEELLLYITPLLFSPSRLSHALPLSSDLAQTIQAENWPLCDRYGSPLYHHQNTLTFSSLSSHKKTPAFYTALYKKARKYCFYVQENIREMKLAFPCDREQIPIVKTLTLFIDPSRLAHDTPHSESGDIALLFNDSAPTFLSESLDTISAVIMGLITTLPGSKEEASMTPLTFTTPKETKKVSLKTLAKLCNTSGTNFSSPDLDLLPGPLPLQINTRGKGLLSRLVGNGRAELHADRPFFGRDGTPCFANGFCSMGDNTQFHGGSNTAPITSAYEACLETQKARFSTKERKEICIELDRIIQSRGEQFSKDYAYWLGLQEETGLRSPGGLFSFLHEGANADNLLFALRALSIFNDGTPAAASATKLRSSVFGEWELFDPYDVPLLDRPGAEVMLWDDTAECCRPWKELLSKEVYDKLYSLSVELFKDLLVSGRE